MKPLIKWPGGKSGEIAQFEYLIPECRRYIEPFVGGGALYFHLNPEQAVINDTSRYLMDFYTLLQQEDPELHRILDLYCRSFGALKETCRRAYPRLHTLYQLYAHAAREELEVKELRLHTALTEQIAVEGVRQIAQDLVTDWEEYLQVMADSVEDKILRTVANDHRKPLSAQDLKNNLVTGFTSGFYLYFRNVFNAIAAGDMLCSKAYRIANFYFIREYCYGSMFRYNGKGDFNIPYGGISYNKKDLSAKIHQMYAPQTIALLRRTRICCEDFEELMQHLELTGEDFLFLDPPYDTEFSSYEGHAFAQEDHMRLAQFLYETPAKFILVIQNTPFIDGLYQGHFRILHFENRYSYNVRSRNQRASEHLIVTNIPEGAVPWLRENVALSAPDPAAF